MPKVLLGEVVSLHMENTAVVNIVHVRQHPVYKKRIKKDRRIKADTSGMKLAIGDTVKIQETRPIAKEKHFRVLEVVKK